MTKYLVTLLALVFGWSMSAIGQKPETRLIEIEKAESLEGRETLGPDVKVLKGDVVFSHAGSKMYCDSSYFYTKTNSLVAYGRIHINQGDSIHLYGDTLRYYGNQKVAKVLENVILTNDSLTLTTNELDFLMNQNIASYSHGGTTINKTDTLTSQVGRYYTKLNLLHFQDDVRVRGQRFNIKSDTLKHNTEKRISYFFGPTEIVGDSNYIYCENGWYDHTNNVGQMNENALYRSKSYSLLGDSLYYDRTAGYGEVFKNIELQDTSQHVIIKGNYGLYREKTEYALITDRAIFAQYDSQGDTLFMHADTLQNIMIQPNDSTQLKYIKAYHGVRSWRRNLQNICDSLVYIYNDSVIEMHGRPVIWSDNNQIFADFIKVYTKNEAPDHAEFIGHAFATTREDTVHYNQLKGKTMSAYFLNSELNKIEVHENGEVVYVVWEDKKVTGLNKAESEEVVFFLKNKKLDGVLFPVKTKGAIYPLDKITDEEKKLNEFVWHADKRPIDKDDIFRKTVFVAESRTLPKKTPKAESKKKAKPE